MRWRCYRLGRRDSGGCVGRYGSGFRVTLELPRVLFDLINQRSPRIFTSIISLWLYFLSILFHLFLFYMFFFTLWSYSLFIRPQLSVFLSLYRFLSFTISLFSVSASISLFSCIPHSLYFMSPSFLRCIFFLFAFFSNVSLLPFSIFFCFPSFSSCFFFEFVLLYLSYSAFTFTFSNFLSNECMYVSHKCLVLNLLDIFLNT